MTDEPRATGWMQTFTGKAFYPLDPRPEDIDIRDIAHGLSMTCRYSGQVGRFYSVAEHCVLMASAVSQENALWALMHDAPEAYIGDMVRPLKQHMPAYKKVDQAIMTAICHKWQMPMHMPSEVARADNRILLNERAALLGPSPMNWHPSIENEEPLLVSVTGWAPNVAERRFLSSFEKFVEMRRLAER